MKPARGGLPIFVQLLALAVLCLVSVQLVNLAAVLLLPDPPPDGYSIADAARALQGHPVMTQNGLKLAAVVSAEAPDFGDQSDADTVVMRRVVDGKEVITKTLPADGAQHSGDALNPVIAEALSQALNVAPDRVRAAVDRPQIELYRSVDVASSRDELANHVREHTQLVIRMDQHNGPAPHDLMGAHMAAVMKDSALFPPFSAALKRPDGRWSVITPPHAFLSGWHLRILATFLGSALIVILIAWFAARRLARPIHAFALAAERLGADPHAPPLSFEGPAEVRTAVVAFNDMQEKLRRYVAERTLMIASIAHDLRTPLTRLRFRVEAATPDVRDRTAADIEQMDAMISAALAYARGETRAAELVKLDLTSLISSVAEDMQITGAQVAFDGGPDIVVLGDAIGLKRLVANLIDNAVKFGGEARVSLAKEDNSAILAIDDDGPGLPDGELERVFDPFYRPDTARTASGGFGLGLSTARSIARAHGGDVRLLNRPAGGLRAEVRLPAA